jgi:hypothetical protein
LSRNNHSGLFKQGRSGNPSGRPKVLTEVRDLARAHTPDAVNALVEALKRPQHAVAAAIALLDRGWGKPLQTTDLNLGGIEGLAAVLDARRKKLASE